MMWLGGLHQYQTRAKRIERLKSDSLDSIKKFLQQGSGNLLGWFQAQEIEQDVENVAAARPIAKMPRSLVDVDSSVIVGEEGKVEVGEEH